MHELLVDFEDELSLIDEEPTSQDLVQNAVQKKNVFFHSTHQVLLSPIQQIPNEILGEILIACLPPTFPKHASISTSAFPLLALRVCRRWHAVALSTPRLWTLIAINIPRSSSTNGAKCVQRAVLAQIHRSGACLLDVHIRFPEVPGPRWEESQGARHARTRQLMDPVLSVMRRWRSVRMEGAAQLVDVLGRMRPAELVRLESVELNLDGDIYAGIPADFLQAPAITRLVLGRRLTGATIATAPWERLTELSFTAWVMPEALGSTPTQTLATALARCVKLQRCFLRLYGWVYRAPDIIEAEAEDLEIRLPCLEALTVHEGAPLDIHRAWDLPLLREVEFYATEPCAFASPHTHTPLPEIQGSSLHAILKRTNAAGVRVLTTQMAMHSRGDLGACLALCAGLRSLVIGLPPDVRIREFAGEVSGSKLGTGSSYKLVYPTETEPEGSLHDELLASLMPGRGPSGSTMCPMLESFECVPQRRVFSERALVDFVAARCRHIQREGCRLRRVVLDFGKEWREGAGLEVMRELGGLVEEGIEFNIL